MSRKLSFLRENLLINDAVLETSHEYKVRPAVIYSRRVVDAVV
jgi:hypothetical protein